MKVAMKDAKVKAKKLARLFSHESESMDEDFNEVAIDQMSEE